MNKCKLCKTEVEEVYECERCRKKVCLECTYDDYPYNTTLCAECGAKWEGLMDRHNFER
jgi:hypothetical protein